MKITVEFNDLSEVNDFITGILIAPRLTQTEREEPKKKQEFAPEPKQEPSPEPAPEKKQAPAELRVEVRKLLAQVNKKTGANTASGWIKEIAGKDKLTEVEDVRELAALKAKAQEALNG